MGNVRTFVEWLLFELGESRQQRRPTFFLLGAWEYPNELIPFLRFQTEVCGLSHILSAAGRSEQCPLEEKYLIQFMWPHQNALAWWNKWTLVAGRGNTLLLRYWYRTWILSAFSCGFITSLYKGYWVVYTRSLSIEKLCGFFVVVVVKAGQNGSNIQTCNLSTWKAKSGLARPLSG